MIDETNLAPLSEADLAEQWFALRNRTWRAVVAAVMTSGIEQKKLAERIGMDAGQFNKIVTGKRSNLTLRTLHKIARAINHRLQISLVPLSNLPKPNYSYEASKLTIASTSSVMSSPKQFRATTDVSTKVRELEFVS
jgi:DNA-binding Xre family transcriptional regulator